jgi:hypothetical protein
MAPHIYRDSLCPFALCVFLTGCASLEHDIGTSLDKSALGGVGPGAHYAEVLDKFGPPTKMSALADGMAFVYEHATLTERQYGLILPGELGKWIKAVYASADADIQTFVFVFDEQGNLLSSDSEVWKTEAGAGMSMTLIFSTGSFTDTERYETAPARPLGWGKALTMPPLVTLNARQNLETGQNGIQLTTSPVAVGQHTLELDSE